MKMYFKNSRIIILVTVLISIIIPVMVFFYVNYKSTHFRCDAIYSARKSGKLLVSKSSLVINGRHGTIMMDGRITDGNANVYFFKLRNYLEIERNNFSYNFTSQKVLILPESLNHSKVLSDFLADVLIKEGVSTFFYLYPLNDNYVITSGNMPIFFCIKH